MGSCGRRSDKEKALDPCGGRGKKANVGTWGNREGEKV